MSNSMPKPKGKCNSAVGPTMYRLVLALKAKCWLSAASRKLLRGTPAFTPKENGCAKADTAPNKSRNSGLIKSHLQVERFAQVDAFDLGVASQGLGTAGAEDPPIVDDVGPIGHQQGLADVVVGHQDADAGPLQVEDDALQLEHLDGVDAGEGLVQQQEAGADDQRACDFHAAPLAAREHVAMAAAHFLEAQLLDELLHGFAALARAHGQRFENGHQVLFHRELAEDGSLLWQVADAAARAQVHGQAGNILLIHQDAAGIGTD